MERSEELDGLERKMRESAGYFGYRDPKRVDRDRADQALYVGLCIRELCDTLVGRVATDG